VGKVVAHGGDVLNQALNWALEHIEIVGIKTNVPALLGVLADERFVSGRYDTSLLGK
jgi:acetyl/propionyl-CoA carboxylase alpha subunit